MASSARGNPTAALAVTLPSVEAEEAAPRWCVGHDSPSHLVLGVSQYGLLQDGQTRGGSSKRGTHS